MGIIRADRTRAFVQGARFPSLPVARRARAGELEEAPPSLELKSKDAQALVVGSSLIAAAQDVPADVRQDIVNCTLFAQLVASGAVTDPANVTEWYRVYFNALATLGWAQNGTNFNEYTSSSKNFQTHKSIISVISLAFGPQAAAVVLITETLNALQSMDENSPWITIFDQQSVVSRAARFQVATAAYGESNMIEIALLAFDLRTRAKLTQVLFFKQQSKKIKLRYAEGKAIIYEDVLAQNREDIATRLAAYRKSFIKEVKLAPPPPGEGSRSRSGARRARP